jgi:hypothetical protein
MKHVVLGAVLGLSLPAYVAAQLWREPYTDLHAITALDPPSSPVVLADGTLSLRHPLDLMRVLIGVRARGPRAINSSAVTLRLAAGPFEDRMLTIRVVESPKQPPTLLPRRGIEGVDRFSFERLPEDPPIDTLAIRRDTKVVVTVERVVDTAGRVIFDNKDSREQLWEALTARP